MAFSWSSIPSITSSFFLLLVFFLERWHIFLIYIVFAICAWVFNVFGARFLDPVNRAALIVSIKRRGKILQFYHRWMKRRKEKILKCSLPFSFLPTLCLSLLSSVECRRSRHHLYHHIGLCIAQLSIWQVCLCNICQ